MSVFSRADRFTHPHNCEPFFTFRFLILEKKQKLSHRDCTRTGQLHYHIEIQATFPKALFIFPFFQKCPKPQNDSGPIHFRPWTKQQCSGCFWNYGGRYTTVSETKSCGYEKWSAEKGKTLAWNYGGWSLFYQNHWWKTDLNSYHFPGFLWPWTTTA